MKPVAHAREKPVDDEISGKRARAKYQKNPKLWQWSKF